VSEEKPQQKRRRVKMIDPHSLQEVEVDVDEQGNVLPGPIPEQLLKPPEEEALVKDWKAFLERSEAEVKNTSLEELKRLLKLRVDEMDKETAQFLALFFLGVAGMRTLKALHGFAKMPERRREEIVDELHRVERTGLWKMLKILPAVEDLPPQGRAEV